MAEQQLNDTQVRAVIQQMRGKRVAESVRRQVSVDARVARQGLDPVPTGLTA